MIPQSDSLISKEKLLVALYTVAFVASFLTIAVGAIWFIVPPWTALAAIPLVLLASWGGGQNFGESIVLGLMYAILLLGLGYAAEAIRQKVKQKAPVVNSARAIMPEPHSPWRRERAPRHSAYQ